MVRYEIAIILKSLPKDQLKNAFRTAATTILNEGALLRQIQYLGHRKLPYRMVAHEAAFDEGKWVGGVFNHVIIIIIIEENRGNA